MVGEMVDSFDQGLRRTSNYSLILTIPQVFIPNLQSFSVAEIEIVSGGGGGARHLMNRQKFCLYVRSVTSNIILGRPGEALHPLVTKSIHFSNKQKF